MDVSMQLYQIGSTRLAVYSEEDNYLYDDSAVGKPTRFMYSNRIAPVNTQFARESREIKWSGLLLGTGNRRQDQTLELLRSQVGLPQPIIGYVYPDPSVNIGCGCRHCSDGCTILWFEALGEITRVRPRSDNNRIPELEITIDLHSHWRGLNRYLWYWGSLESKLLGQKTAPTNYRDVIEVRDWPTCQQIFNCTDCHVWEYQDYTDASYRFDPDYWDALLNCSAFCQSHRAGKAGSWQTGNIATSLFVDQGMWGAEPIAMYAFKNLPQSGEIFINVSYRRGVQQQVEQTRLDLADIDAAITAASQGNLLTTDVLYAGDILERKNGISYPRAFILRDGEILANVFVPIAESPQYSPGKIGTGHARVSIIVPNNTIETAYQFMYQRV
jgi:hypothetical protein